MPKKQINKKKLQAQQPQVDLVASVMAQVNSGMIKMKPKWYFIAGFILTIIGLGISFMTLAFLLNLLFFSLRQHGPMFNWKLELVVASFPWWMVVLAIIGVALGIRMLRQFDFTYKKNRYLIALALGTSMLLAALLIDQLELNEVLSRRGSMKMFYQQLQKRENSSQPFNYLPRRGRFRMQEN